MPPSCHATLHLEIEATGAPFPFHHFAPSLPSSPTTVFTAAARTMMDRAEQQQLENTLPFPNLSLFFAKLFSLQADIIYDCLVSLTYPFTSLFSLLSHSFLAEDVKHTVDSAVVHAATAVPASVATTVPLLIKKLLLGLLGAAYVCIVLMVVMVVAVLLGVGLVHVWVEEPVVVRERLYFDYTDAHPDAIFDLGGYTDGGVPVGHTFYVYLVLLLPESDFNREIGMFQVTGELISAHGNVIARMSYPSMLKFQSLPVRAMRTFLMGIPLLLWITTETQTMSIPILKRKEVYPRTDAIRITLIPRAGTSFLPQLYEAEILIRSELPWRKELVRRWKWTFYVWVSIYIYVMLLVVLVFCFRPLILPVITARISDGNEAETTREVSEEQHGSRKDSEFSEKLRRLQQSRHRRKANLLHGEVPENVDSTASSIDVTREDTSATAEEVGDSESVCLQREMSD